MRVRVSEQAVRIIDLDAIAAGIEQAADRPDRSHVFWLPPPNEAHPVTLVFRPFSRGFDWEYRGDSGHEPSTQAMIMRLVREVTLAMDLVT